MDAHDELFYRLNDPDPHTQVMAALDLLYKIFGGNFVERWPEWNGFEDALLGRKLEVLTARWDPPLPQSSDRSGTGRPTA